MSSDNEQPAHFKNDRHALYQGWIAGIAMRHGVPIELITDESGNYTNHIRIPLGDTDTMIEVVVPEPPADWKFE